MAMVAWVRCVPSGFRLRVRFMVVGAGTLWSPVGCVGTAFVAVFRGFPCRAVVACVHSGFRLDIVWRLSGLLRNIVLLFTLRWI